MHEFRDAMDKWPCDAMIRCLVRRDIAGHTTCGSTKFDQRANDPLDRIRDGSHAGCLTIPPLLLLRVDQVNRVVPLAQRRICGLCGRAFAIVVPVDESEVERDRFCGDCARLPPPPDDEQPAGG